MTRGAKLGQHFLKAGWAAKKVAHTAGAASGETMLEIGPGKGVLTKELLALGAKVIAVEIDEALIPILEEKFSDEIASGQLRLVHADILGESVRMKDFGFEGGDYRVAANIPYYITGAIIRGFLSICRRPKSMTLLVQKEVAERISRSKKESLLSLSVKAYGTPRYVETVKARDFSPPPKVDSAILHIAGISGNFFADMDEAHFFSVLHAGFASKRKFLANNLATVFEKETVTNALAQCDIDAKARAENVELKQWRCVAKAIS